MKLPAACCLFAATLLLVGCSDSTGPVDSGVLHILAERDTLEAGVEVQFLAVLVDGVDDTLPAEGVLWSSSNPDVASVSADGRVTGHASGTARIVALTADERAEAAVVVERRFKAAAVAVGPDHICALDPAGKAWCFGQDTGGSLGLGLFGGSTAMMTAPVFGGLSFSSISTTWSTSCGLGTDGRAWCWGYNAAGNGLGHAPAGESSSVPVVADTLRIYQFLASGGSDTCGLSSGELFCWGLSYGKPRAPLYDPPGIRFSSVAVAAGMSCGVTTADAAVCWDADPFTYASGPAAPQFSQLSTARDRDSYSCGVATDGTAWCWGNNDSGQLGNGTTTSRDAPAQVSGQYRFTMIVTHPTFACGLDPQGAAICWGANDHGQLGGGDSTAATTPRAAVTDVRFASLSANPGTYIGPGQSRVCGVTAAQDLYCWGEGFGPVPRPILY